MTTPHGTDPAPVGGLRRRDFLAALGGAAASLALVGAAPSCSPGRGPGRAVRPIGLQLYTVRSLMAEDVERTLGSVASAGYDEVEFAGYFDHPPAELRRMLDDAGLGAPSAHVPLESLQGDAWRRTLDAAETLGHRYLIVPWIAPEARRTLDDYRRIAERLETAGAAAAEAGFRLGYHNHEFEFETVEGRVPYELILATDPDRVALQLDLFWARVAGVDPVELFQRHPGRFPSVHVKDMTGEGVMTDVGSGVIDWAGIFDHAGTAGIRHYFVEHDDPQDPLASIRNSANYLARLNA